MSLKQSKLTIQYDGGETISSGSGALTVDAPVKTTPSIAATTDGTGTNQSKHVAKANIAASTGGVTFDLTACPGGVSGSNVDFSANGGSVKRCIMQNTDPTNTITITQPVSHGWQLFCASGLSIPLGPGDVIAFAIGAGVPVVTASNNLLTLTSNAGTPILRITMEG